ncbi:hypothetical protein HN011_011845, partial [Eciton burchellii]
EGDGGDGEGSDGGGCVSQERGCEAARYGRVDADDRQSGIATRAFRVCRFSPTSRALSSFEFRLRNVLEVAGNTAATLSPVTSGIHPEDRQSSPTSQRTERNQGRGNIATPKAPRRRNRLLVNAPMISHSAEFEMKRFPTTVSPRRRSPLTMSILLRRTAFSAPELGLSVSHRPINQQ